MYLDGIDCQPQREYTLAVKIDNTTLLVIGLLAIVFASSAYCYEPPMLSIVSKETFISLPAISRLPIACYSLTNQQGDPPANNYQTTTITTTSSYVGTASLPTTTTTTI